MANVVKQLQKQVEAKLAEIGDDKSKLSAYHWQIRMQFRNNLGLPAAQNNSGYKFQEVAKPELLDKAIEAHIMFAHLVEKTNCYRPVLAKMDRNMRNSDRASKHAAILRDAAKQAKETTGEGDEG